MIFSLLKEINQEVQITRIHQFDIYNKLKYFVVTLNNNREVQIKTNKIVPCIQQTQNYFQF